jgi:inward rectifier potassium channel
MLTEMIFRSASRADPRRGTHYDAATIWLHWLTVAFVAVLWTLGQLTGCVPRGPFRSFWWSVHVSSGLIYPATFYGRVFASTGMVVGMAFTALMTGLLFVRFSRPKARITYAKRPVIARHDGQSSLMIRIANARLGLIAGAGAHLVLLRTIHGPAGQALLQVRELALQRSHVPLFSLTWTLIHKIDLTSPLADYDASRVGAEDVRLLLSIHGRDLTHATAIVDMKAYGPADVLFGMRYVGAVSVDADGHPVADLTELSPAERDIGSEPPQSGWVGVY